MHVMFSVDSLSLMKALALFLAAVSVEADIKDMPIKGMSCAPGWRLSGSKCMFREEIDFMCDGKKWFKYGNTCVKLKTHVPGPVCEPGYYKKQHRTVDKNDKILGKKKKITCASKEKVDAVLSCPEGYTLESRKKCIKHDVIPALGQECGGIGYTNTGTLSDGTPACPLGSSYDHKTGACWVYEEIRPQRVCPYPYVQFGEVGSGWRCQLRDRMPMAYECDKGYEMHEDGTVTCIKRLTSDKKKFCPKGWTLSRGTSEDLGFLIHSYKGDFSKANTPEAKKQGLPLVEFEDKCSRVIFDLPLELHRGGKGFDIKDCKNFEGAKLIGEVFVEKYDPPDMDFEGMFIDVLE